MPESSPVTIVPATKVTQVKGTVVAPRSTYKVTGNIAAQAAAQTPVQPDLPTPPVTKTSTMAPPVPPPVDSKPPERTRATDDVYSDLRRRAQPKEQKPATVDKPEVTVEKEAATVEKPEATVEKPELATEPKPGTPEEIDAEKEAAIEKKSKVNPWKLIDEYKVTRAKLEQEITDLRKLIPDESKRKSEVESYESAQKRLKELEDEIRFVNYSKSSEFADKYEKPYEAAWKRAMSELAELRIEGEIDGTTRTLAPQDLLELVNLPLQKARERARESYGEYADDVMRHRQEIRRLFDERTEALERARVEGTEREKKLREQSEAQSRELQTFLADHWRKANEAALADPENGEFFKPAEGDEERSELLARGYELVDKAFAESPLNPQLSQDERVAIVKRHAAIRNRAAAYGTLKLLLRKEREAHQATLEKLKQYESSTPSTEAGQKKGEAIIPGSATAEVFAKLRALAK